MLPVEMPNFTATSDSSVATSCEDKYRLSIPPADPPERNEKIYSYRNLSMNVYKLQLLATQNWKEHKRPFPEERIITQTMEQESTYLAVGESQKYRDRYVRTRICGCLGGEVGELLPPERHKGTFQGGKVLGVDCGGVYLALDAFQNSYNHPPEGYISLYAKLTLINLTLE